jgi:hypothetical protein
MRRFNCTLVICGLLASSALAGTIHAHYEVRHGLQQVKFTTNLPGHTGPLTPQAAVLDGDRLDLPPGPGVDTIVPDLFSTACVEIGESINVPADNTHPNVLPLLGATTQLGGYSGPVYFDAVRTESAEKLWGAFLSGVINKPTGAAFQLAMWEIAFDTDLTLSDPSGTTPLYVAPGQFQAGITDVAEAWLTAIRTDSDDQLARVPLALLTGPGIQDLVTQVPEPMTLSALALVLPLLRRRG